MKYLLLIFFSVLPFFIIFGQAEMAAKTRHDLSLIQKKTRTSDYATQVLPINKIGNERYISILAKVSNQFNASDIRNNGIKITSQIKDILSLKVPLSKVDYLVHSTGVLYVEVAEKIKPTLDKVDFDIRSDSVYMGVDLPQPYTGKGVYIGVLDWGFDYTHPMYYDTLLEKNRIVAAWDQYKTSGPSPEGFDYGTVYATPESLAEAKSDTSNIYGFAYHGGHVAGIAGGGGGGSKYKGVAFDSEFLFATFLINVGSVLDAYQWMYEKAQNDGKRLVINQSWGLYHIGNLDGTSLLSQAIENYIDLGVVFTTSAGNNGNVNFHIKKDFDNDTLRSNVAFYTGTAANYWGQSLTLWGEPTKNFKVNLKVMSNTTTLLDETPFYSTSTTTEYIDSFLVIGNDTVYFNLSAESENPFNNRPHARMRVKRTNNSHVIIMQVVANDGTVHAWNVAELTTDVGNMGSAFTTYGIGTIAGDNEYGIGEPACTERLITVASHIASFITPNGNLYGGNRSSFSSLGPTYDGRIKPDISAPGTSVMSAISSFTDSQIQYTHSVTFNDKNYGFARLSGTSMSSPVVAGVVALILEANPSLSPDQVKEIILQTAYEDAFTGDIPPNGSTSWGFGKIDAHAAIKLALNTSDIIDNKEAEELKIYPNPTKHILNLEGNVENKLYFLYSSSGRFIQSDVIQSNQINLSSVSPGVYLLKIENLHKPYRVIVE